MMSNRWNENVFIGLGSNVGDRRTFIERSVDILNGHRELQLVEQSSIIETEPEGEQLERRFLNGAVQCSSRYAPGSLLNVLEDIERDLGRAEKGTGGPRCIDLDVLFFGDRVIDRPDLKIPHPRAHKRTFVLEPMVEIAPDFVHPVLGETMKELLSSLSS
jgi:2-amino-4-hydroxy-6-hydroxymethyldihydropteridine diphosphokinase